MNNIEINKSPEPHVTHQDNVKPKNLINTNKDNLTMKSTMNENRFISKINNARESLFSNPLEPQICSICSETCLNINALIKHRAQNHGAKKFQCQNCGMYFSKSRKYALRIINI